MWRNTTRKHLSKKAPLTTAVSGAKRRMYGLLQRSNDYGLTKGL